ncbi:MAG: 3,4-dihydroxy-2-butanone-4-phosphate synthase [Candidatus Puniceispirillales bacterium WSBS_2018_MAG_OTU23]
MDNAKSNDLSSVEEIIEAARNGEVFILIDDESRENEGDVCVLAEHATPEAINFMAKYARGLICLALDRGRVERLGLPLMQKRHESRHETAFTVSIEARDGVTTGISAHDRSRTIEVASNPIYDANHITTPGHIFPLMARDGGTLVRAGHTEAMVDIARAAGSIPAGVICEVMNDDGTMARLPDLIPFAREHGLKIGTIADLIAWRRGRETIVKRGAETLFTSKIGGDWRMIVYINTVSYAEHLVLIKGDITSDAPVLVRMHGMNIMTDVLGDDGGGNNTGGRTGTEIQSAMKAIAAEGRGVIVMLREPSPTTLSDLVEQRAKSGGMGENQIKSYGVGAQILLDLGIDEMELLSNTQRNIVGLDGYGLTVTGYRSINTS